MRDEIMSRSSTAVMQAAQYRDSYNEHAYLWTDDRKEFLEQFLKYGHVLTQVRIGIRGDLMLHSVITLSLWALATVTVYTGADPWV